MTRTGLDQAGSDRWKRPTRLEYNYITIDYTISGSIHSGNVRRCGARSMLSTTFEDFVELTEFSNLVDPFLRRELLAGYQALFECLKQHVLYY